MEIDFQSIDSSLDNYEAIYTELVNKTWKHLSLKCDPIISVSFIDNKTIHSINNEYRHVDRPTDVISFAFLDGENNREKILKNNNIVALGDIYISVEKAKEQADEYGHSLDRELKFLFVHGLLHLLGYDHMNENDEKIMFALQDEILPREK